MDHLFDKYGPDKRPVLDTTYIPEMTDEGYTIVTADHAQKKTSGKHAAESKAYREAKAKAFWLPKKFVNPGKKSDPPPKGSYRFTQASMLCGWWLDIKREAESAKAGELFDVDERGKIKKRP